MAIGIAGPDALRRIDGATVEMRRMLEEAIASADRVVARQTELRGHEVELYRRLATVRLEVIDDADPTRLDRLHVAARELLDQHDKYVAWELSELQKAAAEIAALEAKRAALSKQHLALVAAYETEVARVEAELKTQPAYTALMQASETAAAISARAHQKLDVAEADLESKGAPYKTDKLFNYLYARGFRTPAYRAGPFIRFMDGWVASLCKYDQAWMNYQRLEQLPQWLADHASDQDKKAAAALEALEQAEQNALEKAGANRLRTSADEALTAVHALDADIAKAEAKHQAIAARHTAALSANEGPAREARRLLEDGLKRASFQELRTLAAETLAMDDDRLVDALAKLRTEDMQLELEAGKLGQLPDRLRRDLGELEDLRRQFKQARFDSGYAVFSSAALDDVLTGIMQGRASAETGIKYLADTVRHTEPQAEPGFGGHPRSRTIGLPDVLGEVIWEIAKESGRGRTYRGGSINFPSGGGRRSPRINLPSGGGRSGGGGGGGRRGGFKTGGGF